MEEGLCQPWSADLRAQPGGLPLLQHTLSELFARRQRAVCSRVRPMLSSAASLAHWPAAPKRSMGLDDAAQAAARQLFLRLVVPGEVGEDTRRRTRRSELAAAGLEQGQSSRSSRSLAERAC